MTDNIMRQPNCQLILVADAVHFYFAAKYVKETERLRPSPSVRSVFKVHPFHHLACMLKSGLDISIGPPPPPTCLSSWFLSSRPAGGASWGPQSRLKLNWLIVKYRVMNLMIF